ncbi:DUF3263 domain-containing protein [Aeromicrobium phragmitis]|nr:DUF3263 domain-containing protein [Aeromicrobium phragmitis]
MPTLTAILDFERKHPTWQYAGAREAAIREKFGISSTRYTQLLVRALHDPEAEGHDPVTVHRLRRKVEQQRRRLRRAG